MTGSGHAVRAEPAEGPADVSRSAAPREMPAERAPDAPSGPSENLDLGGPPDISPEELLSPQAKAAPDTPSDAAKDKAQAEASQDTPTKPAPKDKVQAKAPQDVPAVEPTVKDEAQARAPQDVPAVEPAVKDEVQARSSQDVPAVEPTVKDEARARAPQDVPTVEPEPEDKAHAEAQAPSPSPEAKAAERAGKVEKSMSRLPAEKAASDGTPPPASGRSSAEKQPSGPDQRSAVSKPAAQNQPRANIPSSSHSKQSADAKPATADSFYSGPPPKQPYQWVRVLETVQNQILNGNRSAHLVQRQLIADIGAELAKAPDNAWKEPRNARAAVTYVLSGGDPRVITKLMKLGEAQTGISDKLLKGLYAYAKGKNKEAVEALTTLSPRKFHPGPGGHLALAQATLTAQRDAAKAMAYLDDARLLSPGTLVEEAALRRTLPLALGMKDFDTLLHTMECYVRRFNKSVYATTFYWNFARGFTLSEYAKNEQYIKRLTNEIDTLDKKRKKIIYRVLAEQSIVTGNLKLSRIITQKMADLSKDDPELMLKSQLYEAAILLFGDKYDYAASVLNAIDAKKLGNRDRDILKAALIVAKRLREPVSENAVTTPPQASAAQGKDAEMGEMSPVIKAGRTAIATADELLNGTGP